MSLLLMRVTYGKARAQVLCDDDTLCGDAVYTARIVTIRICKEHIDAFIYVEITYDAR